MDHRGWSLAIGVLVAVLLGVGSAFGYHQIKFSETATNAPSPTPLASPSEVPSPSPTVIAASPSPSPSRSPSASPSPSPRPTATPAAPTAASPAQLSAGSTYPYSGSGILRGGAADSRDTGTAVCAVINDSTQAFPAGYEGVFFVAIKFTDGNRISAGFIRDTAGRMDFGTVQNNDNGLKQGTQVAGPSSGPHTYCVSRSGSNWVMRDDGKTIYQTSAETSATSSGQLLFESSAKRFDLAKPQTAFGLVVPGIHDITTDGKAPTQLSGFSTTL